DTIEEFASENATVVVGTVIDPEMSDELKVTVVATGLGNREMPGVRVLSGSNKSQRKSDGTLDFDQLDLPAVLRRQNEAKVQANPKQEAVAQRREEIEPQVELQKTGTDDDMEFLEIPAFLRRQAD
ncbi:MAG: cell division protein FtsZ, partial [Motiliproteus sp.]|nr:cell division protein FtsZ [Motiliproteus sp.]MCW9052239.1 cell division protein FtsZ [Motiliproteus sp.]